MGWVGCARREKRRSRRNCQTGEYPAIPLWREFNSPLAHPLNTQGAGNEPRTHGGCGACASGGSGNDSCAAAACPRVRRGPARPARRCRRASRGGWPDSVTGARGRSSPAESSLRAGPCLSILGVSGVVGCDEVAFALSGHEGPAEPGFQVVVKRTQRVQLVQAGVPGLRPRDAVVGFGAPPGTAGDGAAGGGPQQRRFLRGGGSAAQMGDVAHVAASVMTSLAIAAPNTSRATVTGTGPTPAISHSSPPVARPRRNAATSTRNSARYRGFTDRRSAGGPDSGGQVDPVCAQPAAILDPSRSGAQRRASLAGASQYLVSRE
jgi:hypothetical protein